MGDTGDDFRAHREADKIRKAKNLAKASPSGWKEHTQYHWSRTLNGQRLDYWPSRNKFQYMGKIMCGDVEGFIRNREKGFPKQLYKDKDPPWD